MDQLSIAEFVYNNAFQEFNHQTLFLTNYRYRSQSDSLNLKSQYAKENFWSCVIWLRKILTPDCWRLTKAWSQYLWRFKRERKNAYAMHTNLKSKIQISYFEMKSSFCIAIWKLINRATNLIIIILDLFFYE